MADAAGECLVDQRAGAAVGGEGGRAAVHELPEGHFLAGPVADMGVLGKDDGVRPGDGVAVAATAEGDLPYSPAAVASAGLEHPDAVGAQPGGELAAELGKSGVQVGIGAPAERAGGVQDFLGAHLGDDVRR